MKKRATLAFSNASTMKIDAMKIFISLAMMACLAMGCTKEDAAEESSTCSGSAGFTNIENKITVTQGIYGTISFTEGNCMPGPGPRDCRTCPVSRTVKIYRYTTNNNAIRANNYVANFYERFTTELVAETKSDANGFYQLTLPAGNYTMVVVENGLLYAAFGDGQGGIQPITVATGKAEVNFGITYKAAF
jgi:hypothetical protein